MSFLMKLFAASFLVMGSAIFIGFTVYLIFSLVEIIKDNC